MNRKATCFSIFTLAAATACASVTAAQSVTVPAKILACADEVDVMARLSCYDREVAALRETPAAPAQSSGDDTDFGYDRPPEDITANVVELRERPHGEPIILLDNGQIREQKHVDRRFKLRIGETVTIRKSSVAGYRLSGDGNRSIQVSRRK